MADDMIAATTRWIDALAKRAWVQQQLVERAALWQRLAELEAVIAQYEPIVAAHFGPPADVPIVVRVKPTTDQDIRNAQLTLMNKGKPGAKGVRKPKRRKQIRWTPEVIEGTRARYEAGERPVDIAADLGVSPSCLSTNLHRFGVPPRRIHKRRSGGE